MSRVIPLSEPTLNGKEWQYVKDCLDTGWLSSSGKYVEKFEQDICRITGAKNAVALSSGTAALHIALKVLGVGSGDEVIVPTVTFIASANSIRYVGAEPVFMDCDPYYNINIKKTIDFINTQTVFDKEYTFNKMTSRPIRAVMPVHVFGNAVDLEPLLDICRKRNIKILEDATESLGTFYKTGKLKGRHAGTIGDIGCLSFNGNKIITTGGGGMLLSDNSKYAERVRYLANQAKDDGIHYIHNDIGYNFRLNNVQAAIGVGQLKSLKQILKKKRENYQTYKREIELIEGLSLAEVPPYAHNNYWMYALRIDSKVYGRTKEDVLKLFLKNAVSVRPMFYLNHLQRPYKDNQAYKIQEAYNMLATTLNIPCSFGLTQRDINKVVRLLKEWKK